MKYKKLLFLCGVFLTLAIYLIAACTNIAPQSTTQSENEEISQTVTTTPLPTQTYTPTHTFTATPTPTLFGGFSGSFYTLEGSCTDSGDRIRSNIVLYNVNYEIVLWNADGTRIGTLWKAPTPLSLCYIDTEWSPTGDAVFVEYWKDGSYLLILDSTGKEIFFTRTGLNFYGGYTGQANWSPDGKWLVFSSYGENNYVDIYRVDSDGNNLIQLTNTYGGEAGPLFTPDNKQITYSDESGRLHLMDSDGNNRKLLFPDSTAITDWSTNGKKALLWKFSPWDIFVMDVESRETIRYTFDGQNNFEYFRIFSPDENWILFTSQSGKFNPGPTDEELVILPIDGSQEPRLLAKVSSLSSFRFTPDGEYIVFEGWTKDQETMRIPSNYYAIRPDGTGLVVLSKKAFGLVKGKWQPGSMSDYQAEFASSIAITPTSTPKPDICLPSDASGLGWEFNIDGNLEGWEAWNQLTPLQVINGCLITQSTGSDPYMISPKINISAKDHPIIQIRMKVSAGNYAELYFVTNSDGTFDETKVLRFDVIADGQFHTYNLDMSKLSKWNGTITQIRLDPAVAKSYVAVDYVRITGR